VGANGSDHVLECAGLRKSFDELVAVDGVGFHIARGETYGLLGPNGAGKTTTISMICGLLERDAGSVIVDGQELTTRSVGAKKAIGYVPQEIAIYPDLSARENLSFFGRMYGLGGDELKTRVDEVLETIGLADRASDKSDDFSGGMKRRLNIGIGLLHRPQLLVLDEPTVGVDPQSRNAILESVENLSTEGMAVLYTTHYMEEAERLCNRVGIIDHGKVVAEGTRRELIELVGQHDRICVGATGDLETAAQAASSLAGIREAGVAEDRIDIIADSASDVLPEVLAAIGRAGASVQSAEVDEPNLEAVFLHLTGRALRD
jgi:ABC-2 type transport system ATP-binding protein